MKKSKRLFIVSILLGLMLLTSIGSTFAYFIINNNHSFDVNTDITNENVLEVSSFDELYKASINPIFNDSNNVSSVRKIIKFKEDIELLNNVDIKVDAHIDLNDKKLKLNGYELRIVHGYEGAFCIENGTIYPQDEHDRNGRIVIATPKASIYTNNLVFKDKSENDVTLSKETFINIEEIDFKYTAYRALYEVNHALQNDLERYKDLLSYDEVMALDDDYGANVFTYEKHSRILDEECYSYFIAGDIDLPFHYLSNNLKISYSSSDEDSLTSFGKINAPTNNNEVKRVTLSVNVTLLENTKSLDFDVVVVNKNDTSLMEKLECDLIKEFMGMYFTSEKITFGHNKSHDNGCYLFRTGVELPLASDDFGLSLEYKAYSDEDCLELVETQSITGTRTYFFEPNENCFYFKIICGDDSIKLDTFSTYISSLESVCRSILNSLYGGSVVYDSSSDKNKIYSWEDISNDKRFEDLITTFKITNVTYSFEEDSDASNDYSIGGSGTDTHLILNVNNPTKNKESGLKVTFTLNGVFQTIDMYIIYISSGGDTVSGFMPYYSIFTNLVPTTPTLEEFEMPLSYGGGYPYVCYDFATDFSEEVVDGVTTYSDVTLNKPDSLIIELVDGNDNNQLLHRFTYASGIIEEFNAYLVSAGYYSNLDHSIPDVDKLVEEYPGAKWRFRFDTSKISFDDLKVLMIYNYKFSGVGNWRIYNSEDEENFDNAIFTDATTSSFEINGGLFYQENSTKANAFRDKNLFIYVYNLLKTEGEDIDENSDLSQYAIINDWLSLLRSIDVEDENNQVSLLEVEDWNGIQYFYNCSYINLSGVSIADTSTSIDGEERTFTVLDLVAKLTELRNNRSALTELRLQNCGLQYDYNAVTNADINNIVALKNTLKILDISNKKDVSKNVNKVSKFEWIEELTNIEKVYIYNNFPNSDTIRDYYGSLGICNYQTYEDLVMVGISIYYDLNSNNVPVLFEDCTEANDYTKLKGIVYQKTLREGADIRNLYLKFASLTPTDFNLSVQTGATLTWKYEGQDEGKDPTTATYFYVTYRFVSGGIAINLVVKYYIDRY